MKITVSYFFEGDDSLPFELAEFDAPPQDLVANRITRLSEWIGDNLVCNGTIEAGATVTGPVYIGQDVTVSSTADIRGPVYIADRCFIGHGAQLRPGTILGRGCIVGHAAEIKNSVCMQGAKLQSGSFVGDSIVGVGGRIGSGVITANRRFAQDAITLGGSEQKFQTDADFFGAIIGDFARIGANATTAPGTMIGPYSWILPLVSAYGFIPRETRVGLRQELEFSPNSMRVLKS